MNIKEAELVMEVLVELGPHVSQKRPPRDRVLIAGADHEVVYLDIGYHELQETTTLGRKLAEADAFRSREYNCWAMFV